MGEVRGAEGLLKSRLVCLRRALMTFEGCGLACSLLTQRHTATAPAKETATPPYRNLDTPPSMTFPLDAPILRPLPYVPLRSGVKNTLHPSSKKSHNHIHRH